MLFFNYFFIIIFYMWKHITLFLGGIYYLPYIWRYQVSILPTVHTVIVFFGFPCFAHTHADSTSTLSAIGIFTTDT